MNNIPSRVDKSIFFGQWGEIPTGFFSREYFPNIDSKTKLTQMQVDMLLTWTRGEIFQPTQEEIHLLYWDDIKIY